jgi:hypothetical protein
MIEAELADSATRVRISRSSGVDELTWLAVRAELGSSGNNVNTELVLPLERFLVRRASFGRIAQRAGVAIALGPELRAVVLRANDDEVLLRTALAGALPLEPAAAVARLEGGRFDRELRGFQKRDLARLLDLGHGANFSVPGAGKTTVAYAAYEAERLAGRVEQMMVVAPLSAFESWEEEAKADGRGSFAQEPVLQRFEGLRISSDTEVTLVNYQRLSSGYEELAAWVGKRPTLLLLDEAHRMKRGWAGQWGSACLNLAHLARRRDILTGTPAPQGPRDFIALIDYLWPGEALRILPRAALVNRPPPNAARAVATAIRPLFARTTKRDLNLPKVQHCPITVPLQGLHRDIYLALRERYAGELRLTRKNRGDFAAMGRVVMYMLEAATNPKLLVEGSVEGADPDVFRHPPLRIPAGSDLGEALARYNLYETPEKFTRLAALIKENAEGGRKTLVWSNFVRNLELLKTMLARYQPALVHGGLDPVAPPGKPSREREIRRFRNDANCLVLLANPAAMSEGISLHKECHDAIYLERTFNAGQYLQSVDRIHRLGLLPGTKTHVTFLITDATIDVTVDRRVREKAKRLGEMLDDPNLISVALPNDEDYGPPVEDELDAEELFRHLRGED